METGISQGCRLTTPIQHSVGSSGQGNQARERNKGYSNKKTGSQFVFADDIILYLETPSSQLKSFLSGQATLVRSRGTKLICRDHKHSHTPTTDKQKPKS